MAELKGMSNAVRLLDQISSDNARDPFDHLYIYVFFNTSDSNFHQEDIHPAIIPNLRQ
jgi:hypothetical protein